jgi:lysophospholipid acyltransferase (LPLAT)-like uncharacterized protein
MGLLHFFWASCRIVRVIGAETLEKRLLAHEPAVICYWHRHQIFCWRYLRRLIDRGARIGWLISASVDGEVPAEIAKAMGGGIVFRGSTTSGGAEALRSMCRAVMRDGISPAATPDGPRGPRSQFKEGIVKLAQLSGAPLVPLAYAAKNAWVLNTWDRFVVPRPFTRIAIAAAEPVFVPRRATEQQIEELQRQMEAVLEELYQTARRSLG